MMREQACAKIDEAISRMNYEGTVIEHYRYGSGHINDTFVVVCRLNGKTTVKYLLQRMNHEIFKNPDRLMKNIAGVTSFLRDKIIINGGDPKRETLNVVPTKDGYSYYVDSIGSYWRSYLFIDDTVSYDLVERTEDFYLSAVAFGKFQRLLADYPAHTLYETIKDFHNTRVRFENLKKAINKDICSRAKYVKDEIEFALAREADAGILVGMLERGELPLRVTHNDTKLNNILFDKKTNRPVCIIDLDTIMPGLSVYDFGDSIRFGASTGAEDEKDLSKINFSLELYEAYVKGFLEGTAGSLTKNELDMLPMGAKIMTYECGIRFLTDYLEGDRYFRIHREDHNLDRCRTQFKLVSDMEEKFDIMKEIVSKYS